MSNLIDLINEKKVSETKELVFKAPLKTGLIEKEKINSVINDEDNSFTGGLWVYPDETYSVYIKENEPSNYSKEEAVIKLESNTKVYEIDSYEKLAGLPKIEKDNIYYINMEQLSKKYDLITFNYDKFPNIAREIPYLKYNAALLLNKDKIVEIIQPDKYIDDFNYSFFFFFLKNQYASLKDLENIGMILSFDTDFTFLKDSLDNLDFSVINVYGNAVFDNESIKNMKNLVEINIFGNTNLNKETINNIIINCSNIKLIRVNDKEILSKSIDDIVKENNIYMSTKKAVQDILKNNDVNAFAAINYALSRRGAFKESGRTLLWELTFRKENFDDAPADVKTHFLAQANSDLLNKDIKDNPEVLAKYFIQDRHITIDYNEKTKKININFLNDKLLKENELCF